MDHGSQSLVFENLLTLGLKILKFVANRLNFLLLFQNKIISEVSGYKKGKTKVISFPLIFLVLVGSRMNMSGYILYAVLFLQSKFALSFLTI